MRDLCSSPSRMRSWGLLVHRPASNSVILRRAANWWAASACASEMGAPELARGQPPGMRGKCSLILPRTAPACRNRLLNPGGRCGLLSARVLHLEASGS